MNCNNEQLNFTCGGDQQLYVTLRREGQAFPAELSDDVVLNIVSERAERINVNFQVGDDGKLLAMLPAEKFQQPVLVLGKGNHVSFAILYFKIIY